MKRILKKLFTPFIVAIVVSFLCGKVIYKIYEEELDSRFNSYKIYLLESGKYDSYESMREDNVGKNYLYYVDDGFYKSVVGITKKYNNINKIKNVYSMDLTIKEYYLSNDKISIEQDEYDKKLEISNDINREIEIINNVINLYKNDETIKLIDVIK